MFLAFSSVAINLSVLTFDYQEVTPTAIICNY